MKKFHQSVAAIVLTVLAFGATSSTALADVEVVAVMAMQLQLLSTGMDTNHQQLTEMLAAEYSAEVKQDLNQRLIMQMNTRLVTAYLL